MKYKHQETEALKDVLAEMQRQDAKWGADRNLDPFIWGGYPWGGSGRVSSGRSP
ncbi:hypothetical protein ACR92U_07470 [Klebsiella pneumoniae]